MTFDAYKSEENLLLSQFTKWWKRQHNRNPIVFPESMSRSTWEREFTKWKDENLSEREKTL